MAINKYVNKYGQRTGSPLMGDDLDQIGNEENPAMFVLGLIILAGTMLGLILHFG